MELGWNSMSACSLQVLGRAPLPAMSHAVCQNGLGGRETGASLNTKMLTSSHLASRHLIPMAAQATTPQLGLRPIPEDDAGARCLIGPTLHRAWRLIRMSDQLVP